MFKFRNNSVYGKTETKIVHIKISFRDETKAKILIQKLPFFNILTEKSKIRGSKNIDLLHGLTFYSEINIMQISDDSKLAQEIL